MRRARFIELLLVAVLTAALAPAAAARSQVSFTQMEDSFMCVACHEALSVAQSPESFSERSYLRQLIAQGLSKSQIKSQFVAQYGPAVLAKPPASGFNLLIYILPPAVLLIGAGILVYTLPRWRRRTRQAVPMATAPPLDPADAQRLDDDLARQS